ncbi:MAG: hypothetical protein RL701_389, partial [Pseudomonadota bacterium]
MVCPMFARPKLPLGIERLQNLGRDCLLAFLLVPPLAITGTACKAKEETAAASATDEASRPVGDLELPVSLRTHDTAPADAHKVEITTSQLRINGVAVASLVNGAVADEDQRDGIIPKLDAQLRGQSHNTVALRLAAIVPYVTTALVLNTAKQAGVANAAFQVRETGNGSLKSGWIAIDNYVMASRADDIPPIQSVTPQSWDAFTGKWKDITAACKVAATGNCAYADSNFAKGGTLKIELHTSGRGLNVNFFRRGLNPAQQHQEELKRTKELQKKKEQFLQGHLSHEEMVEFLLLGDPSTQALFQFRFQEALSSPSALSATIAPLCRQERCGIVVAGDLFSPTVRIATLLGAAFPDGTTQPAYAFEMPWTKKP